MTTNIADRFAEAQPEWDTVNPSPASLWVDNGNGWSHLENYNDPYDAMTPLVLLSDNPAVLEMFGKMTRLDDNDEPTDETVRVRVMFGVCGDDYQVLVQRPDGELFTDEGAQGMFLDLFLMTKQLLGR